jgi:hypothetical protein
VEKILRKLFILIFVLTLFLNISDVSAVSATNNTTFTIDQVSTASGTVQSYVETNHKLPSNVTMAGTTVSMSQYLKLSTTALLNINGSLNTSIALKSFGTAPSPQEDINNGYFNSTEYLGLAKDINSFIDANGRAPNYQITSLGKMRYESLVYMYSQILSSYQTNKVLPGVIMVNNWKLVSNTKTIFLNLDQVISAAGTVKSYVETNHKLPVNVTIGTKSVTMPQFLELLTSTLLNVNCDSKTSLILGSFTSASNPTEVIATRNMKQTDYVEMACYIQDFMDYYGRAPNYAYKTSLGNNIRFESLIYMYSQILDSYNTNSDYRTIS